MHIVTPELTARRAFFVLLFATTVLLGVVVRPIAGALFMGAVLAGVLAPLHARLASRMRGRRGLAAAIFVALVLLLLLGPVVTLAAFLVRESSDALRFVSDAVRGPTLAALLDRLPVSIHNLVSGGLDRLSDINQTLARQLSAQGGKAVATLFAAAAATGSLILGVATMLIALYFLLADGDQLVAWLDRISPLRAGQTRELLAEFRRVSFSVIVSTMITSAVQALAALAGYLLTRVPHPVFFAALTFFVAFIPAIGAAMVCLLAAGILFITGHPYAALFLAIWGIVVVGLVDNVIKPLLIRAGMEMRGAVVFFALIGGLGAFGAIGLLVGPLVVALFLALVRMYLRDYGPVAVATGPVRRNAA